MKQLTAWQKVINFVFTMGHPLANDASNEIAILIKEREEILTTLKGLITMMDNSSCYDDWEAGDFWDVWCEARKVVQKYDR